MPSSPLSFTGSVTIEQRVDARVWVARYRLATTGRFTRKVLGPAWARESGKKTSRGAAVWRAAPGSKPDGYLTPREAQARLDDLIAEQRTLAANMPAAAVKVIAGSETFGDAVAAWLAYVTDEKKLAPSTLRSYRHITSAHLLREFPAGTPLRRVTKERIERYRTRLLAGTLSRNTMRLIFFALKAVLTRARKRGWIAYNPMNDVDAIPTAKASGDFNVLSPVQIEAVARAAADDWEPVGAGVRRGTAVSVGRAEAWTAQRKADAEMFAAVIRVAAHTGLRLGELRALRWCHVDWLNGVIHVKRNAPVSAPAAEAEKAPKSGKVRSVPITDVAARELDRLSKRPRFTDPEDYVFPSTTGAISDGADFRDAFYRALKAAGLGSLREKDEPIVFHDLRHTFGTLAVRAFPITDVQEMMGHADLTTTKKYVHYVPRHDAGRKLSAAFAIDAGVPDAESVLLSA